MTVLAVLKLTGSEFQLEGAATAKALEPHFVRKYGTVNTYVLDAVCGILLVADEENLREA